MLFRTIRRDIPLPAVFSMMEQRPRETPMPRPEFFREKARECRRLLEIAVKPEVIAQLEIWVREFEDAAREAERDPASAFIVAAAPGRRYDA
jgi:hypothetical protein